MKEKWLSARIYVRNEIDKIKVITGFISPIVKVLDKRRKWLKSFHFMRYSDKSGIYIRFRILSEEGKIKTIRKILDSEKDEINSTNQPIILKIDYTEPFIEKEDVRIAEEDRFGKEGWKIFLDYFEYISRITISLLERSEHEKKSHPIKYRLTNELLHFLLNPLGYRSFNGNGEITSHLMAVNERLSTFVEYKVTREKMNRNDVVTNLCKSFGGYIENSSLGFRLRFSLEKME